MSDILPAPEAPIEPLTKAQKQAQSSQALMARYNQINPSQATQTAATTGAPAAQTIKPANLPDTSIVGNAPSWLRTQNVTPFQGGPQVALTNPSYEGLPDIPTDWTAQEKAAADAAYKGATQYFDEDFGRANSALEAQLMNQGFARGSQGFDDAMALQQRGQDAARLQAAYAAQGVGHQQAGDLLMRALQTRSAMLGERNDMADRLYNQSMGVANLALGKAGQNASLEGTRTAAHAAAGASMNNAALNAEIALRNLGLSQDAQDFNQSVVLANLARGGVNMPNFGAATPLDVGGAYGIASGNNNANLNRQASDRNALYQLGGTLLGSYLNGY